MDGSAGPARAGVRIRSRLSGREWEFTPERAVVLARGDSADVALQHSSVSRSRQAELRWTDAGWVLSDTSEYQRGIGVAGTVHPAVAITGSVVVIVGDPAHGEQLELTPYALEEQQPPEQPAPQLMDSGKTTVVPVAGRPASPYAGAAEQMPTRWRLGLVLEGARPRVFEHLLGAALTVGRDAGCTVVTDAESVSRRHATITAVDGGWSVADTSTGGTWRDGTRLSAPLRIDEDTDLRLGDALVGPLLRLTVYGSAERRKRRSRAIRVALVAAVVVLVAAATTITLLVTRGSSGDNKPAANGPLTGAALRSALATTARLDIVEPDGQTSGWGSGTVISADGLILTNSHVAAPQAPGLATQYGDAAIGAGKVSYLRVLLTKPSGDGEVHAAYRARAVAADGYIDLAVVKIYANADGSPLKSALHLAYRPVGDSEQVKRGDTVTLIGFPGISDSPDAATVTEGIATAFSDDAVLHSHRAWIETSARIAHGNSGGSGLDSQGRLIGVPTESFSGLGTDTTFRMRPVQWAMPLIAKAKDGSGSSYKSPYITYPGQAQAKFQSVGTSEDGLCDTMSSSDAGLPAGTSEAFVAFTVDALPAKADYFVTITDTHDPDPEDATGYHGISNGSASQCVTAPLDNLDNSTYKAVLSFDPPGTGEADATIVVGG